MGAFEKKESSVRNSFTNTDTVLVVHNKGIRPTEINVWRKTVDLRFPLKAGVDYTLTATPGNPNEVTINLTEVMSGFYDIRFEHSVFVDGNKKYNISVVNGVLTPEEIV